MLEPFILLITVFFFWYPAPNWPGQIDRADWVWLLGVIGLLMLVRWVVRGRLWTPTMLDGWFIMFLLLGAVNVYAAPYESRGLFMLARPILGMALVVYFVELTRTQNSIRPALWIMAGLSLFVGVMALGTTQWTEKSTDFLFIINLLPDLTGLFDTANFAPGGFNPNEIGGALAWLVPLMLGVTCLPADEGEKSPRRLQIAAGFAYALLLLALMLGQSRAAIIGVLVVLFVMTFMVVPRGRWRHLSLALVLLMTVTQAAVLLNVFPDFGRGDQVAIREAGLNPRDERTTNQRFDIWDSAFSMVADYPLTGVGMARFRYNPVRDDYPIPNFDFPASPEQTNFSRRIVPHAHNEFIQIATDLGLPGLVAYTAWHLVLVYMAWIVWRRGDKTAQVVIIAAAGGLLAHATYGLGDAIPLWDRFSFIYWLMVGLVAAQYTLHTIQTGPQLLPQARLHLR